jgi:hypothetical protein
MDHFPLPPFKLRLKHQILETETLRINDSPMEKPGVLIWKKDAKTCNIER